MYLSSFSSRVNGRGSWIPTMWGCARYYSGGRCWRPRLCWRSSLGEWTGAPRLRPYKIRSGVQIGSWGGPLPWGLPKMLGCPYRWVGRRPSTGTAYYPTVLAMPIFSPPPCLLSLTLSYTLYAPCILPSIRYCCWLKELLVRSILFSNFNRSRM